MRGACGLDGTARERVKEATNGTHEKAHAGDAQVTHGWTHPTPETEWLCGFGLAARDLRERRSVLHWAYQAFKTRRGGQEFFIDEFWRGYVDGVLAAFGH